MKHNITRVVIHCSATKETSDYSFEQLERDHKARGFDECGYSYYIRKDGTVHEGREIGKRLAHATGFNTNAIAICYEGGLDSSGKPKDTRTPQQKQALLNIILFCKTVWPNASVLGHRDLSPDKNGDGIISPEEWLKDCPCFDVRVEYQLTLKQNGKTV